MIFKVKTSFLNSAGPKVLAEYACMIIRVNDFTYFDAIPELLREDKFPLGNKVKAPSLFTTNVSVPRDSLLEVTISAELRSDCRYEYPVEDFWGNGLLGIDADQFEYDFHVVLARRGLCLEIPIQLYRVALWL